jgi:hypothetical protein
LWDVKQPTTKDAFGNTNNSVDAHALVRDEAAYAEDVRAAGAGVRWMIRAPPEQGGRWRPCSREVGAALDRACRDGADRARAAPRIDVVVKRRHIGGELAVDWAQLDVSSGVIAPVRPVGAFPLRVPPPIHDCYYGLDEEDGVMAEVTMRRNSRDLARVLQPPARSFDDLPDAVVVAVLQRLLSRCECTCHEGQILADSAVYALCTMELVSRRFHSPRPDLSLPEQAARNLLEGGAARNGPKDPGARDAGKARAIHDGVPEAGRREARQR